MTSSVLASSEQYEVSESLWATEPGLWLDSDQPAGRRVGDTRGRSVRGMAARAEAPQRRAAPLLNIRAFNWSSILPASQLLARLPGDGHRQQSARAARSVGRSAQRTSRSRCTGWPGATRCARPRIPMKPYFGRWRRPPTPPGAQPLDPHLGGRAPRPQVLRRCGAEMHRKVTAARPARRWPAPRKSEGKVPISNPPGVARRLLRGAAVRRGDVASGAPWEAGGRETQGTAMA